MSVPPVAIRIRSQRIRARAVVDLVERPRDLDRKAGLVREGDDPDVAATGTCVRVVGVSLATGDAQVVFVHRQLQVSSRST